MCQYTQNLDGLDHYIIKTVDFDSQTDPSVDLWHSNLKKIINQSPGPGSASCFTRSPDIKTA